MPETIVDKGTGQKWHWYNVQHDLVEQGGLEDKEVMIDPLNMNPAGCGGKHKGNPFYMSWSPDSFLMVTSKDFDQQLIDAFAKVVDYKPFARYKEPSNGLVTTEWDKTDPEGRYKTLEKEGKLELTRLVQ
ncbi:hypothetical protein ACFL6I_11215 [candidate division KSB1 bacterium]